MDSTGCRFCAALECLLHVDNREHQPVAEIDIGALPGDVAVGRVERNACERGAHFEAREACLLRGMLAGREQKRADAAAGPLRMDEERPDLRRIASRIEEGVLARRPAVAAKQGSPAAPAAAANDAAGLAGGDHGEVGAIGNQLAVDTVNLRKRGLDLLAGVVGAVQAADRNLDQFRERGRVVRSGQPEREIRGSYLGNRLLSIPGTIRSALR